MEHQLIELQRELDYILSAALALADHRDHLGRTTPEACMTLASLPGRVDACRIMVASMIAGASRPATDDDSDEDANEDA